MFSVFLTDIYSIFPQIFYRFFCKTVLLLYHLASIFLEKERMSDKKIVYIMFSICIFISQRILSRDGI